MQADKIAMILISISDQYHDGKNQTRRERPRDYMKNTAGKNHLDILIVEDSRTQAEELRYILEKKDYRVSLAVNGKEALHFLQRRIPDIVITDILMPEMDGYELCKHIRADQKLRKLPVILVTSLSEPTDVIKGLEAGANNFITKPYDEKFIISRIEYLIANRELRRDTETDMGAKVFFSGHKYFITAERLQILDLLLSTYENAYHQNRELLTMQEKLRQLNERLQEEKAKTESIIAAIGDGISIQDLDLTIVYQNEILISTFGDHRGEKCYQAYSQIESPCNPCPVLASFEDGNIHNTEMIRPTKHGISHFEATTSPLRDATGEIIAGIMVVRNVDQRKKLEQERENLIHDLEEARANLERQVAERTAELTQTVDELQTVLQTLLIREKELQEKNRELHDMNTTLNIMLKRRDQEHSEIKKEIAAKTMETVLPLLKKAQTRATGSTKDYMETAQANLLDVFWKHPHDSVLTDAKLAPRELQIVNYIRQNKTSKEIADLLSLSVRTIESYRENIRKKLGIQNQEKNLKKFLTSLL